MKPRIYFDPFVLACPNYDEGLNRFEVYINNIISLSELRESEWASMYISEQTVEVMAETGCYPLWDRVSEVIENLSIEDIHPKDVITIVESMLLNLQYIEQDTGVKEVLLNNVYCRPDDNFKYRIPIFIEQYKRIVAYMSLKCSFEDRPIRDQILITNDIIDGFQEVAITGQIIDAEVYDPQVELSLPFNLYNNFIACNCPHDLYMLIDPANIWVNAISIESYIMAISISIYQAVFNSGVKEPDITSFKWSFGKAFLVSAKELGFLHQEVKAKMLIRACTETVIKENTNDTHWLRTGEGANDPQKRSGNDKAWRRDIDYEFHLHYWETLNGPEFAVVVVHNDMDIPN